MEGVARVVTRTKRSWWLLLLDLWYLCKLYETRTLLINATVKWERRSMRNRGYDGGLHQAPTP